MANYADKGARDVGQLAQDMVRGYAAHIAAVRIAPRMDNNAFVRLIGDWPSDFVQRKDGSKWSFDTQDALVCLADKVINAELPRVWLTGSLLALGDALKDDASAAASGDSLASSPKENTTYYLRRAEYIGSCDAPFGGVHAGEFFFVRSERIPRCRPVDTTSSYSSMRT